MSSTAAAWIQPQHLQPDAIAGYRKTFESHPARLLVLKDFLRKDKANKLQTFLEKDTSYEVEYGLYSTENGGVPRTVWERADEADRFFRFSKLSSIRPEAHLGDNTFAYMQFKSVFADPEINQFFEALTGLDLAYEREDIGVHSMTVGDYLRSHNDDNRDRRLAMIIYLTPGWRAEFGGVLNVVQPDGEVTEIVSEYNSLAMFDVRTGATHHVSPVSPAAGDQARRTIGGWYHAAG